MLGILKKTAVAVARTSWFRDAVAQADAHDPSKEDFNVRRWDASKTHRLNSGHWAQVTGQPINADLDGYLTTLRNRCAFEASTNENVAGVIETHVTDMVGENGPTLQVQSGSDTYNDELEEIWADWWAQPDLNGQLTGTEILDLDIWSLWINGEYLHQLVTDRSAKGAVKLRLLVIDVRRLLTAPDRAGRSGWLMGVQRDSNGKPKAYSIQKASQDLLGIDPTGFIVRDASSIDHGFRVLEAGQVRGVPWLATGLQAAADLKDVDQEVLDAIRQAANYSVAIEAPDSRTKGVVLNETTILERGTRWSLPPGYKAVQMKPEQPGTGYKEYRDERLRGIGRVANMPLMIIKLDAAGHNYSSARFEDKNYGRSISKGRAWIAGRSLNRFVGAVAQEATLARVLPVPPKRVKYAWTWPVRPSVDPIKEAMAVTQRLMNGSSTLQLECAEHNLDWEEVVAQRAKELAAAEKAGLPYIGSVLPVVGMEPAAEPDDDVGAPGNGTNSNGRQFLDRIGGRV